MKLASKHYVKGVALTVISFLFIGHVSALNEATTTQLASPAETLAPQTATSSNDTMTQPRQIKQAVSKISEMSDTKKERLEAFPGGKTMILAVKQLLASSLESETLINKVESYTTVSKISATDTTLSAEKLAEAKRNLEAANNALSVASLFVENISDSVSTSTYKKTIATKKKDFKAAISDATKNIRTTNQILRDILSPKVQSTSIDEPESNGRSVGTIAETENGSSSLPSIQKTLPPLPKKAITNEKLLEQ